MYSAFLNQNIWTCQYFYFGYFTFHCFCFCFLPMQCRWPCQKLSLSIVYVCHIKGCLLTFLPMSLFVISCLSLRIASQSLFCLTQMFIHLIGQLLFILSFLTIIFLLLSFSVAFPFSSFSCVCRNIFFPNDVQKTTFLDQCQLLKMH